MEDTAESVVSADAELCEGRGFGDWVGQKPQRPGVGDAAVGSMIVVVAFVLA